MINVLINSKRSPAGKISDNPNNAEYTSEKYLCYKKETMPIRFAYSAIKNSA
jgi:hypothetical protein